MSRDRNSSSSSSSYSHDHDQGKSSHNSKSIGGRAESLKEKHKKSNSHHKHRSRSSSRSKSRERRKSKNHSRKKSKHSKRYRDKSKDLSPITEYVSKPRRNGSHSRYSSKRSRSRERSGRSRRHRSRSSSSLESHTSYRSRRGRKRSSSNSGDRDSRSGSIVKSDTRKKRGKTHLSEEITSKISKAVEQATSLAFDKISNANEIKINAETLDEINSNSFVPKRFVSQSEKMACSSGNSVIKEEAVDLPQNVESDCLLHPNLIIDEATKIKNWVHNLHMFRMRFLDS